MAEKIRLSARAIFAGLVLMAKRERIALTIEGLSSMLLKIYIERVDDLTGISIRPAPGGYFSEDVASWVEDLEFGRFAASVSTKEFVLTQRGEELVKGMVGEVLVEGNERTKIMRAVLGEDDLFSQLKRRYWRTKYDFNERIRKIRWKIKRFRTKVGLKVGNIICGRL